MRSLLTIACLFLAPGTAIAGESAASPSAIARAIVELGSEKLQTRLAAREVLWKAGSAAKDALHQAAKSDDLETASTARYLLDRLDLGLTPQMPAELIRAAEAFRYGTVADKTRCLPVLTGHKATMVLARLASYEQPGAMRTQTLEAAWKLRYPLVREWLDQGNFADYERFIKDIAKARGNDRDWAVYLTLRGEAENRIRSLQAAPAKSVADFDLLALLLRLRGELPAAFEVAEQRGDEGMIRDLAVEMGRWGRLLSLPVPPNMYNKHAWFAAVFRLAGDKTALDEQIRELEAEAGSPRQSGNAFQALEINDHVADSIQLHSSKSLVRKMTNLAAQGRLPEALACVGIGTAQESYLDWLKDYFPQLSTGKADSRTWTGKPSLTGDRALSVLEAAVVLAGLGQRRQAIELVDRLAEVREPDDRQDQVQLFKTYRKLGSPPQTFACGARVIELSKPGEAFQRLYDNNSTSRGLVRFWWDYLGHDAQPPAAAKRLERADALAFASARYHRLARPSLEFIRQVEAEVLKRKAPLDTQGLGWLAQSCLRYGYRSEAIDFLTRLADQSRSSAINMQLGVILFADKRWSEAAERFGLAFDQDSSQSAARFMKGFALKRAGHERAGEREVELARLMLLGDSKNHSVVAGTLSGAGLVKEAAEEWQLCVRLVDCASVDACNANQSLGYAALRMKDYASAASYWNRCALTIANFLVVEPGALIRFNHVIHSARARGLIEAGKIDDAIAEAARAFEAMPGDVEMPLILVPMLEAAGRADAAGEMFERTYQFYRGVLQRYPKSSWHLNSAAWLAASCHRRLDEALELAQQAVALAPERWAYTDTLAEVYFQQGDRQQAVHWAKKSIALEPDNVPVKQRFDHFVNDPLPQRDAGARGPEKQKSPHPLP